MFQMEAQQIESQCRQTRILHIIPC
ncbi:Protein of unknown function [Pyronema omphalodes CBS 100304]|uniref:Uncharacterized protein n=1 Tax=Pyronema omphalodes (strain CBS 100304) TaxID=1076935 RepID=U4L5Z8_PYROM|nr:Protein of unknown function [Pyronema omphalodes CBS 100304]